MINVDDLVDKQTNLVSRRLYVDQEVYEQELEQIFARCWCYLAHESQIPNPGDFVSAYIGEDPVLVVRDSRGKINAFLNTCRHRGMRVCRADQGNAAAFTCTYHGWTYGNDGKLVGVPGYKEYYYEELDMEKWGLVPVAQVDTYKGLIFGTFDPTALSLQKYLGDMAFYLDCFVDRREGGSEILGGTHKWIMDSNWKFAADNFQGDGYHVPVTHISAIRVGFSGSVRRPNNYFGRSLGAYTGNGHGLNFRREPFEYTAGVLNDYMNDILPNMEERLGALRAREITPINGTLFPNMSFLGSPSHATIRVWHPRGPDKVEAWSWCIVDKNAPPEVKEATRLGSQRIQAGPAATFEQDDGENWGMCTASSRGVVSQQFPLNYQLRPAPDRFDEELPGVISDSPSERNQRGFYEYWAEMMACRPWR